MPATAACAISGHRPAHFAPVPATGEAASRPHRQEVRRHRYRTFLPPPARSTCRAERFPSIVSGRFHVRQAHGPPARRRRSLRRCAPPLPLAGEGWGGGGGASPAPDSEFVERFPPPDALYERVDLPRKRER